MKLTEAWKVLLRHGNHWMSPFANPGEHYFLDKPTIRREGAGPLAAFRTEADAHLFAFQPKYAGMCLDVIPCAVEPSYMNALWYPGCAKSAMTIGFPPGTIFCDSITLH